jgi:flavin reductase (DIM6/NTAB) family NADH-FMN oxidoreductase RutF
MNEFIQSVDLNKAYRLITHGPTVLVSARHEQTTDVMAAAWACALEFQPAKVTVVLDKACKTRELIEASGYFALQVPTQAQLELVHHLGTLSLHTHPDKLKQSQLELFQFPAANIPVVAGCSAWLLCKLIPEAHVQQQHDLFIAEVIAAYADERIFSQGHWQFEHMPAEWRSLHHVAGRHFYCIGDAISVDSAAK